LCPDGAAAREQRECDKTRPPGTNSPVTNASATARYESTAMHAQFLLYTRLVLLATGTDGWQGIETLTRGNRSYNTQM